MIVRIGLFVSLLLLLAVPVALGCSAEYSGDQCMQMMDDQGGTGSGSGGGGGCPYYMCGNATGNVQANWVWCPDPDGINGRYVDCPIAYCSYRNCVGSNCYPTSMTCTGCASAQGNNVHVSDCPRS